MIIHFNCIIIIIIIIAIIIIYYHLLLFITIIYYLLLFIIYYYYYLLFLFIICIIIIYYCLFFVIVYYLFLLFIIVYYLFIIIVVIDIFSFPDQNVHCVAVENRACRKPSRGCMVYNDQHTMRLRRSAAKREVKYPEKEDLRSPFETSPTSQPTAFQRNISFSFFPLGKQFREKPETRQLKPLYAIFES